MPTYLDFDSTKRFRDYILGKTLQKPNGPQTFTNSTYTVQSTQDFANIDQPSVDANRTTDLLQAQTNNIFKPVEFFIRETLEVLPRRANLSLYPYFIMGNHTLISVLNNSNYDTESELFKFAARFIRDGNSDGPFYSRVRNNLAAATTGRVRIIDALNGNVATASNLLTGREPLVDFNNKITAAKTLPGKVLDFAQVLTGVQFPFTEIPGDYLTDPRNPINVRPDAKTEFGSIIQDVTGVLGSMVGIQRRPAPSRKPSDLMIEYMGEGQKNRLYDLLSYSKYAPNYTTTARSQNTSKLFNFVDAAAQGIKNVLGMEAPSGIAYIGDDRGNDVKFAMNDFNDRPVRSNYYLSLLFDPVQTTLFQRKRNISEGGQISGKLTWISKNSKNKLGEGNNEWAAQQSDFIDSQSTSFDFRQDSILGITQEILDTLPSDGGAARSHVANVIDQTSRIFREGDVLLSRGSAIQYVDKYGEETGVEYCRVWTKDRSYMNYTDTMKRTSNVRKFDDSVLGGESRVWNLNIAPMSNGKKSFDGSTNIFKRGDGYYAKKYMLSIENLAWKTSTTPGFTVNDLPYCERGPNGGRVMWFPPYDLKVSEQNNARWESNTFLGRPEPIYTYQNTERSGQISFKVVVDHPSILNLLVRDHFQGMSDEESENYINAFFAGCEEIDFYDLIRRYPTITKEDSDLIKTFLEKGKDPEVVKGLRVTTEPIVVPEPNVEPIQESKTNELTVSLNFANDYPKIMDSEYKSQQKYTELYNLSIGNDEFSGKTYSNLTTILNEIYSGSTTYKLQSAINDKKVLHGKDIPVSETEERRTGVQNDLVKEFTEARSGFISYEEKISQLKTDLEGGILKELQVGILSSTSAVADEQYNFKLSIRRSHSIVKDILDRIKKDGSTTKDLWSDKVTQVSGSKNGVTNIEVEYTFKDLGYDDKEGKIIFKTLSAGEEYVNERNQKCGNQNFQYVRPNGSTLKISSPVAFGCRQSSVIMKYTTTTNKQPEPKGIVVPRTKIVPDDEGTPGAPPSSKKKPLIDPLKRIIMKTLSECYYFKRLEETDPIVFGSLREKLRYFQPAFHSTTPEGLNARLTFLQQCIRPGETLPIKGISDQSDLYARNTTFGPPPICVLRVGDFYNSKVIIKDVNITFDDNVWDLNPEGIGIQPMIANVTLQVNFIGGHGLREPVNRLQNALSSNFYANTEMYDERSIATNETIGGQNAEEFTKKFLEDLQKVPLTPPDSNTNSTGDEKIQGDYMGTPVETNSLNYKKVIDDVFVSVKNYFSSYEPMYNEVNQTFGPKVSSVLLSPNYRQIKTYTVYTNSSPTSNDIELFGLYKKGKELSVLINGFRNKMISKLSSTDLSTMLSFDKEMPTQKCIKANELLQPYFKTLIETKFEDLLNQQKVKDFESTRNQLIESLDKVNVLVKYGYDFKISGRTVTQLTLSGYTSNLIYDEYSSVFDFISKRHPEFYEDVDTSIDFNTVSSVSDSDFSEILSIWTSGKTEDILNVLKQDTTIFDDRTREKLGSRINKFITNVKEKNFKYKKKYPTRKNDTDVKFEKSSESVVTNTTIIDEITLLYKDKSSLTNNKLNFYNP